MIKQYINEARNGKLEDLLKGYLKRIKELDSKYNAFIEVWEEDVYKRIEELNKNKRGRLFGVPVSVKDNICVRGKEITCGSKILKNHISMYNATVVERLLQQGAALIGRTNMDEFAMGSSTEYSAYFVTKNPFDVERVAGGSSGGSAASCALKFAVASLGSDTGGSIRQPAAFCGVYGFKPTYGRVSRFGLVAFASSLDQIGPFATSIEDIVEVYEVISGYDEYDSTSIPAPKREIKLVDGDLKGIKIGIIDGVEKGVDSEIINKYYEFIDMLESLGAQVINLKLKYIDYSIYVYYIIAPAEASSNLARFDGIRYGIRVDGKDLWETYRATRSAGFGDEVKRRILIGTFSLSSGYYDAYYGKAQKVRRIISDEFLSAFKICDFIVLPTTPTLPFKIGEKTMDPISMYLSDIFTIPLNLYGGCGINIPYGFVNGLPCGMQIISKPLNDEFLLEVCYKIEKSMEVV